MRASAAAGRRLSVLAATVTMTGLTIVITATSARAATPPSFVQRVSAHQGNKASVAVTPTAALGAGNRLVVEVAVWNSGAPTAGTVTDSAGDSYTELLHITAPDNTELSVWSAPITAGAGAKPTITVKPTQTADVGVVALEYAGLSTAAGTAAVDSSSQRAGVTTAAATVTSGPTASAGSGNELAIGFYADSGFKDALTAGSGFTSRANVSPTTDIEMLTEDQPVAAGATANAGFGTGAQTDWLAATVVFQSQSAVPTVPGTPGAVTAVAGDSSADLSWTAPASGGSPITSYTITPFIGSVAQTPATVPGSAPTTYTIGGLTNGTSYTFAISAQNAIGSGPPGVSNAVVPAVNTGGTFSALQTWPIVTIATQLMYNGELVTWDGWQQPEPSVIWNPSMPTSFQTVNAPDSVFCDGAADLPDGRLMVIGGYGGLSTGQTGIVDTNIFDPITNSWTRVANMHSPRWYPTLTELSDGRYVAISGNSTTDSTWADTPEVYDPATNKWTLLSSVNTSAVHEVEYPFSYEVPNGNVFVIGPEEDNSHLLNVDSQTWTSTGSSGLFNGSSVMYRPGKILYSGGAATIDTPATAQNQTAVIDLTAATPTWRRTAPMSHARIYHTLTMLADGTVLAVGGSNTSDQHVITTGVLPTEIWNPSTETWTPSAPINAARNYHSTAVLLPDGRVLVSGGGHPFGLQDAGQYSSQFYSPAYLTAGPRPTITSAPVAATYGSTIPVNTPDAASITGVNLVSLGADTHQIDMNQHFVPLTYTAGGGALNVQAPSSGTIAPPGYYMLFILKNGVPSVASIVHIGSAQTQTVPGVPTNVNAYPGAASATLNWTVPATGGTPITSYTVTPYIGAVAQTPTTVTGNPPVTSATLTGLTNGTQYTFGVVANNAVGASAAGTSNAVTPSANPPANFVQQVGTQGAGISTLGVGLPAAVTGGDRLVVEVGVWNSAHSTATGVTDSAGNTYTEVATPTAPDGAQLSVWTAPVTNGGGTKPTITATASGKADMSVAAMEYSGLSSAPGAGAVDTKSSGSGTTNGAGTVTTAATAAASGSGERAIGFYADSGFSDTVAAGSGWTPRANTGPNGNMELFTEDQTVASGVSTAAGFSTGAHTPWVAATVVFRLGAPPAPTVPAQVTNVTAVPGHSAVTLNWKPPDHGSRPITKYVITPYKSGVAQTPLAAVASATGLTVRGLTDGESYNFAVAAVNPVGRGTASSLSNTVSPTATVLPFFVQQVSKHVAGTATARLTPAKPLRLGDRLVVEVGTRSSNRATTTNVRDTAGNRYTELLHFAASDGTELSVWSAPITAGGGREPTVTATTSAAAEIGLSVMEYAGLSAGAPVDVSAHATGTATTGRAVSSGSTTATTGATELTLGFYADSGFHHKLTPDPGFTMRSNVSLVGSVELLTQDAPVSSGAAPAPSIGTGARTVWLAATIAFRTAKPAR